MDEDTLPPLVDQLVQNLKIRFIRLPFFNDEPKIFQYQASIQLAEQSSLSLGFGSDRVREHALSKAICESVERRCLLNSASQCNKRNTVSLPSDFIEPQEFQPFSQEQLNSGCDKRIRLLKNDAFVWTQAIEATSEREVWIPAQLVFCPYDWSAEALLRFPSSNGAALGSTLSEARCRAVLELIERDAFMCWYLSGRRASILPFEELTQNNSVAEIRTMYQRYHLELVLLLLPSPWPVPVIAAVIIDHTGLGPGLRIGLKCHPNVIVAIDGAVAEAQQMRPWLRDHMELYGLRDRSGPSDVVDSWSRALFWAHPGSYREIDQLWSEVTVEENVLDRYDMGSGSVDWDDMWRLLISTAKENQTELYLCDLKRGLNDELEFEAVKAVSPQTHPLYMDERLPYLSSRNLKHAIDSFGNRWSPEVSMPPHPFS